MISIFIVCVSLNDKKKWREKITAEKSGRGRERERGEDEEETEKIFIDTLMVNH